MLSNQPRPTGVTVTTIHFPSPHPTSFAVAGATLPHGTPQITTAGRPQEQPQWNQTMFFLGDESSLFTAKSAVVVEYYPAVLGKVNNVTGLEINQKMQSHFAIRYENLGAISQILVAKLPRCIVLSAV